MDPVHTTGDKQMTEEVDKTSGYSRYSSGQPEVDVAGMIIEEVLKGELDPDTGAQRIDDLVQVPLIVRSSDATPYRPSEGEQTTGLEAMQRELLSILHDLWEWEIYPAGARIDTEDHEQHNRLVDLMYSMKQLRQRDMTFYGPRLMVWKDFPDMISN
ncbi:uncharacterized protein BO97DRAFT_416894 [Aspergillus homomorphus CBS 101889]|uniref:Uncharacterized protein n=1 Tax=Aspergillus homomorphus (strain CBS 101889) TaxID=1450537 RepID=A0A395HP65_ASPHC|nr:hypothetical protein BO97DRAFT_416894 [Aspergillus homomorphus CBS 101889]RAL09406.1 hypothetical protein BO97DRAFT_416894 [Aspergillus homomorphus CBS 101889]